MVELTVLQNGGATGGAPITLGAAGGINGGPPPGALGGFQSSGDKRIRVGRDYQAVPPPFIHESDRTPEQCTERDLLVWSPVDDISGQKLDEFIQDARENYGYNSEQALGILFCDKHDLDRAKQDLANFTPFMVEWSMEDKVLFEQAFQFHGKKFQRIRQMLPDKSIAALVEYYYSWKKTRTRTSLMDRQAVLMDSCLMDSCLMDRQAVFRNSNQPPLGMHLNHGDLLALATGPPGEGETMLRRLDREIVGLKRQVQNNKQILSTLHRKARVSDVLAQAPYRHVSPDPRPSQQK